MIGAGEREKEGKIRAASLVVIAALIAIEGANMFPLSHGCFIQSKETPRALIYTNIIKV